MSRIRSLAAAAAVSVGCTLLLGSIGAAQAQARQQQIRQFNIDAQSLGAALSEFARQSQQEILFAPEIVARKQTSGVRGYLSPIDALAVILEGTGLTFATTPQGAILVQPQKTSQAIGGSKIRMAQVDDSTRIDASARESRTGHATIELEEITVTGSRLGRVSAEGAQPVLMFGREEIQRSGQSSVTEFLRTLPEISGAAIVEAPNGSYPHAATVQLRGLPAGRTLMLINGRRIPSTGAVDGGFANLNTIPAAAIERIDVLPQGASAIYGSDALAGVINIILRKDVSGLSVDTKFGSADGVSDRTVSAVWGHAGERGSVSLVGQYYDRTSLRNDERDITRNLDFTRYGWRDLRSETCNPGTVYSADGANLPGLNSAMAAIPAGLGRAPTLADFASTAGQVNRCGSADYSSELILPANRYALLGTADYQLTDDAMLYSELWFSRLHHEFSAGPYLSKVLVPAANPFNPFGTDVRVDYQFDRQLLGGPTSDADEKMSRAVLGARGTFLGDWQWDLSGWAARDHSWSMFLIENPWFVPPQLASTDPQTALNLFSDGSPIASDVLRSYVTGGLFIRTERHAVITTTGGNATVRGRLFDLPAGAVSIALGAEYGREQYENTGGNRGSFDISRHNKSVFGEMRIPLLARSPDTAVAGELLALSAALRRDEYSDFGVATTPQYGIEWRPFETLLVRGSYAEAFRAPDLYTVYGPTAAFHASLAFDPRRNGELTSTDLLAGGNPRLQAETGRSVSAGIVWSSERWSGLRASVNWWRVSMTDRISPFPDPQLIVDNESLFPGRVIRAAPGGDGLPGRITLIDYSALNLGDIWVEGVDLGIDYRFHTDFGTWSPNLRVTRYTRYDALLNPAVGTSDYLARANTDIWVPKIRGVLGLSWALNAWSASIDGRYLGKYRDYNPLNDGRYQYLGDTWTWDLNARWDLGEDLDLQGSWLSKLRVALGAVNLFDRPPQFSASTRPGYGFDAAQYDIRGRYAYAQVSVQF